jgi:hypothetical protein
MAAHTRQLLLTDVRFCYRVGSVHVCCLMSQFVVLSQTFWCHGANRKAVVAVTFLGFCIGANAC